MLITLIALHAGLIGALPAPAKPETVYVTVAPSSSILAAAPSAPDAPEPVTVMVTAAPKDPATAEPALPSTVYMTVSPAPVPEQWAAPAPAPIASTSSTDPDVFDLNSILASISSADAMNGAGSSTSIVAAVPTTPAVAPAALPTVPMAVPTIPADPAAVPMPDPVSTDIVDPAVPAATTVAAPIAGINGTPSDSVDVATETAIEAIPSVPTAAPVTSPEATEPDAASPEGWEQYFQPTSTEITALPSSTEAAPLPYTPAGGDPSAADPAATDPNADPTGAAPDDPQYTGAASLPGVNTTSGLTCTVDDNTVKLTGVKGGWDSDLQHRLVGCSHKIEDWKKETFPTPDHDEVGARISFRFGDIQVNRYCVVDAIGWAGGHLPDGNEGCKLAAVEYDRGPGQYSNGRKAQATVKVNQWPDFWDDNDTLERNHYGLWEIYGISNWTAPDYLDKSSSSVPTTTDQIFHGLYHAMKDAIDSLHNKTPEHWRQFKGFHGLPAMYFGIYSSQEAVRHAISKVSLINPDDIEIRVHSHDGKWDDWHTNYVPFMYHQPLPQEEGAARYPSVDIGPHGFKKSGQICYDEGNTECTFDTSKHDGD